MLIDLATLTGANAVALGKRTAALFSDNDELADGAVRGRRRGRRADWRMPLPDDYAATARAATSPTSQRARTRRPASVMAALYLREFTGDRAGQLGAHGHVRAVLGRDAHDGELVKGATGWGVRTLLRWLAEVGLTTAAVSSS